jgi:predicted nucleic acid-binding protein
MNPGLVDTNIFIHAHATDRHSAECRRFLAALESGSVQARIEPITLHELSYALPHYIKSMTRRDVAEYLLVVLQWPGLGGEKDLMVDAISTWLESLSIGFADAYLTARSKALDCPVYTKNLRDFAGLPVVTPDPLPE